MSATAESALASDRDPVCGMEVDPAHPAGGTFTHEGKTYGFCNPRCRERFAADPPRYLGASPPAPVQPSNAPVEWVCPMHPQIVRDAPGSCPICGMALEPRTVSLEEPVNPELKDMQRRLLGALPFTVALLAVAMGEMFGWHLPGWIEWLELVLATPVVRSGPCSSCSPRWPAGWTETPSAMCRSPRFTRATSCACGRERRSPSMEP